MQEEEVPGHVRRTLLDSILHDIIAGTCSVPPSLAHGFPEGHHPRRGVMYRRWDCDLDTFLTLRARGVPVLTAYFLCEASNNVRTLRGILALKVSSARDRAMNVLNIF